MSSYHEAVKRVLAEINKFLNVTLKSEILTPKTQKERNKVVEQLSKLYADYDSLAPNFGDEGSTSSAKDLGSNSGSIDESRNTGESGQGSEDDGYADNIPETSFKALKDPDPIKFGFLDRRQKSLLSFSSWMKRYCVIHKNVMYCFKKSSDKKQELAFFVTGYELVEAPQYVKEAAKKECSFELVCPGKKSYQFVADSKEDLQSWKEAIQKASKEQTSVNGVGGVDDDDGDIYEDFPEPADDKPSAPSVAITQASPTTEDAEIYDDGESTPATTPISKTDKNQNVDDIEDDDMIYEPIDPEVPKGPPATKTTTKTESKSPTTPSATPPVPPHVPKSPNSTPAPPLPSRSEVPPPLPGRNVPLPPPPKEPLPAIPVGKQVKKPTLAKILHPSEDFENLFYGMWNCKGSTSDELSFQRGEVIHVISRDLDIDSWWVGELNGKIGLVPKTFLSPAFEEVKP